MIQAHCFDAMICIPNCDKIVPGMFMGAMRVQRPDDLRQRRADGGRQDGRRQDRRPDRRVHRARAAKQNGKLSPPSCSAMEKAGCPTCGRCSGMFTANSMNCLCEALGMALPTNGTLLATSADRKKLFRRAAQRIVEMVMEFDAKGAGHGLLPREIVTADSIDNSMVLDMAMGGSTNTVLHILADRPRGGRALRHRADQRAEPPHAEHLQGGAQQPLPRRGRPQRRRHAHDPRRGPPRPARPAEPRLPHGHRQDAGREHRRLRHPRRHASVEEALELAAVTAGGAADAPKA